MTRTLEILLVEDNSTDARLIHEVFKRGNIQCNLHVVVDGIEAMKYLRKEGSYIVKPVPDLILLDLNLPKMDGKTVLKEIKLDKKLSHIPVIILTSSKSEADISHAYNLEADGYLTKTFDMERLISMAKSIESYLTNRNSLNKWYK